MKEHQRKSCILLLVDELGIVDGLGLVADLGVVNGPG